MNVDLGKVEEECGHRDIIYSRARAGAARVPLPGLGVADTLPIRAAPPEALEAPAEGAGCDGWVEQIGSWTYLP